MSISIISSIIVVIFVVMAIIIVIVVSFEVESIGSGEHRFKLCTVSELLT